MAGISGNSLQEACSCALRQLEAEHDFKAEEAGERGTLEYRVWFRNGEGALLSPWHSVPLYAGEGLLNFVCEIPRYTRAKFEVATGEVGNPIKQDSKKGKPRFYGIDMQWNYGMLPQTWEDPAHASEDCGGCLGDNDPVDVVEIGDHDGVTGGVYAVKPLCALAMIDEGELDWKVVAISQADPRFELVNSAEDVEAHFPGVLSEIREWFRTYKTHEGKPLNAFELNEAFASREYTLDVVRQTHGFWKDLVLRARTPAGSGKVAVGDVPVIAGCFEPEEHSPTSDLLAATIHTVLEAVHEHEEQAAKKVEVAQEEHEIEAAAPALAVIS